jgi:hypothetical protein
LIVLGLSGRGPFLERDAGCLAQPHEEPLFRSSDP